MTPPRPPLGPPLGPERLAELLDDAVRHVTAPSDAFDRIRRGVHRRRAVRRAGGILLAVAVLAGGGSTALALTSSHGPSGLTSSAAHGERAPQHAAGTAGNSFSADEALPPPGRALAPAPAAAPSATSSGWDMDGDGRPDTATIVPVGNANTTVSFQLVVRTTRLGTQTVPFTAASITGMPPHGPVIVGAADAAQDGRAELFVLVDGGCCTEFWTIFRLVDGRVRQMTLSGRPVRLAVGGSVMDNGGFNCNGPDLVTYAYQPGSAAGTFLATRDTYHWAGAALVLVAQRQATVHGPSSSPELTKYTGVACGGLPQYESVR